MKNKTNAQLILAVFAVSAFLILIINRISVKKENLLTDRVETKNIKSQILTNGKIASQNEAVLHFQTGGKLTYLSVKEGDSVGEGQTIASLDTYALQRQLTAALNNYRSNRDTFDQSKDNIDSGVLAGQQKYNLDVPNKVNISGQFEVDVINNMIKRIADQNQASLDNSVINVELANYAMQLSSLTAPFDGIIVHEDVNQAGVNVTPLTSFIMIDPSVLVFRAQVKEQDIDFINVGSPATLSLNGDGNKYTGYVSKIYPEKLTLPTGGNYYNVDIVSPDLKNTHYAQAGSTQIQSNVSGLTKLVLAWTILNGQEIWVDENGKAVLRKVKIGKHHGGFTEIISGLGSNDKIIIDPQSVIRDKYKLL